MEPTKRIKSLMWSFFDKTETGAKVICKTCKIELKYCNNTSNMKDHLRRKHPEHLLTTPTSASCGSSQENSVTKNVEKYAANSTRKKMLDIKFAKMVAIDMQPLRLSEHAGLREFVHALDSRYEMPGRTTLSTKILTKLYSGMKVKLFEILKNIKYLAITTDAWTSTTSKEAILAVTAHFIYKMKLESVLLEAVVLHGHHDSDNISSYDETATPTYQVHIVGGFAFTGHFTWIDVPEREKTRRGSDIAPTWSPTMAGGLFAMDRSYYWELGAYDEQMNGWGGENLEISFRIWQCGGTLETVPCSRVGHVFRSFHPYSLPASSDTHGINTARMAEVWMDDYKELFYLHRPDLRKNPKIGDITHRKVLREKLRCKSFQWFLDNIYKEKFVPVRDAVAYGRIMNSASNLCLDTLQHEADRSPLGVYSCHDTLQATQYLSLSTAGELRDEEKCAEILYSGDEPKVSDARKVLMSTCHGRGRGQKWRQLEGGLLQHVESGLCIDAGWRGGEAVWGRVCNTDSPTMKWNIDYNPDNDYRAGTLFSAEQEDVLRRLRGQRRISRSLLSVVPDRDGSNRTDHAEKSGRRRAHRRHNRHRRRKPKAETRRVKRKNKFILRAERPLVNGTMEHLEIELMCRHRRLYPNDTFVRDIVTVLNENNIRVINNGRVFERHGVSGVNSSPLRSPQGPPSSTTPPSLIYTQPSWKSNKIIVEDFIEVSPRPASPPQSLMKKHKRKQKLKSRYVIQDEKASDTNFPAERDLETKAAVNNKIEMSSREASVEASHKSDVHAHRHTTKESKHRNRIPIDLPAYPVRDDRNKHNKERGERERFRDDRGKDRDDRGKDNDRFRDNRGKDRDRDDRVKDSDRERDDRVKDSDKEGDDREKSEEKSKSNKDRKHKEMEEKDDDDENDSSSVIISDSDNLRRSGTIQPRPIFSTSRGGVDANARRSQQDPDDVNKLMLGPGGAPGWSGDEAVRLVLKSNLTFNLGEEFFNKLEIPHQSEGVGRAGGELSMVGETLAPADDTTLQPSLTVNYDIPSRENSASSMEDSSSNSETNEL